MCVGELEQIKPTSGQPVSPRELIREKTLAELSTQGTGKDICRRIYTYMLYIYMYSMYACMYINKIHIKYKTKFT